MCITSKNPAKKLCTPPKGLIQKVILIPVSTSVNIICTKDPLVPTQKFQLS